MTRPANSKLNKHSKTCSLVLEGNQVKVRLIAERLETRVPVHVDWLRFTCQVRNAPMPSQDVLFPPPVRSTLERPLSAFEEDHGTYEAQRFARFMHKLQQVPDADFAISTQAAELALRVVDALGEGFNVGHEIGKGHDFYKSRWSIERNGEEVGWVGFGASGDSPRQQAQKRTLHVNLYGTACTFAKPSWRYAMADLIDEVKGVLTRCDLALDFFEGITGGMDRIKTDYETGLMDSGGKRLKCNMVGDWMNGKARSFYIGSKEVGKQTNIYEKGHQLFGDKDASGWMRAELRLGNKARVLDVDMLRRPADFFAEASPWHASLLREADAEIELNAASLACNGRLAAETIEAEVTRNKRWVRDVAGPSLALMFTLMDGEEFAAIVEGASLPGRLRRFSRDEIARVYQRATKRVFKGADAGHVIA